MRRPADGSKVWGAVLGRVLHRPALSASLAILFLLALAAPMIGIHTERLSLEKQLPADASIMQDYQHITAAFPGGPNHRMQLADVGRIGDIALLRYLPKEDSDVG